MRKASWKSSASFELVLVQGCYATIKRDIPRGQLLLHGEECVSSAAQYRATRGCNRPFDVRMSGLTKSLDFIRDKFCFTFFVVTGQDSRGSRNRKLALHRIGRLKSMGDIYYNLRRSKVLVQCDLRCAVFALEVVHVSRA